PYFQKSGTAICIWTSLYCVKYNNDDDVMCSKTIVHPAASMRSAKRSLPLSYDKENIHVTDTTDHMEMKALEDVDNKMDGVRALKIGSVSKHGPIGDHLSSKK